MANPIVHLLPPPIHTGVMDTRFDDTDSSSESRETKMVIYKLVLKGLLSDVSIVFMYCALLSLSEIATC